MKNKMNAAEVLQNLSEYCNKSIPDIASAAGYSRPQAFYDVINGKTRAISPKMADNITAAFPEINRAWLLTGEGAMLKTKAPQVEETAGMVSMPREVWDVIRDQAASLKAKDKQVEEVIALLKEQIKKGEGVDGYGHAAPQAAQK